MRSIQTRRLFLAAVATVIFAAATSGQAQWTTGPIIYNGMGNIVGMGQDVYIYDSAGRLISGSAQGTTANRQEYSYDEFGNRLGVTTYGTSCVGGCATTAAVSIATNQMGDHGATYDLAGNLKTFNSSVYSYDGAGMIARVTELSTIDWQFIYTAGDERIGTYTGQGNWRFSVRDIDGKILREVSAYQSGASTTWTLDRDHVYQNGLLLASAYQSGQRQQFHLDQVGTPRLVTDANGAQIGRHTLYPFGDELSLSSDETPLQRLKFTGHERDELLNREPLDNMHMRFFSPLAGRFFTIDRRLRDIMEPQGWNRYAYVSNNPMNLVDPSGLDERQPGEEMQDGDTCNGTVVDGWCTGETITVTANAPQFDWISAWAGFGDGIIGTLTFGFVSGKEMSKLRGALGGDEHAVDRCSGTYLGGRVVGTVATTAALAYGAVPATLTHMTTEAGAAGIQATGTIFADTARAMGGVATEGGGMLLPGAGAGAFGRGVYATAGGVGSPIFAPGGEVALQVSGQGFIRVAGNAAFLNGGSPQTVAALSVYGAFGNARDAANKLSDCR
jgi:RHS repeat-associated protein